MVSERTLTPNVDEFDRYLDAMNALSDRRTDLIETLRGHIGSAICIAGHPTFAMFRIGDGNKYNSIPVYSITDKAREPRRLENVPLLDVVTDSRYGNVLHVSPVPSNEMVSSAQPGNDLFGYQFFLNQVSELRLV